MTIWVRFGLQLPENEIKTVQVDAEARHQAKQFKVIGIG
jgi:hypothetical protein